MGSTGRGKRVVVAMSGGVDSSLTAALLKDAGYDVIGVTMQLWHSQRDLQQSEGRGWGCCALAAVEDARRVALDLGIPYYVLNFQKPFYDQVVTYFIAEYQAGRTPNPCIACNRYMKFDLLLQKALELEADFIATGHYARIVFDETSRRYLLKKSADDKKDQTYTLYHMTQAQLAHTLFPLGSFQKEETREKAASLGLKVADKPDSQEICFIPDDDYKSFLQAEAGQSFQPGPIYDPKGNLLGTHRGIPNYTIGQRKGLGLALGEPVYVTKINVGDNSLVVGKKEDTAARGLVADDLNFIPFEFPKAPLDVTVKIRYNSPEVEGVVTPSSGGVVRVEFLKPIHAVTPGQSVVFYRGDTLVGGGTIRESFV
jgi:tRNA-uridine 2-sulfurtransferase